MKAESLVRLSRLTRPFMRYRTPVVYRLFKWALNLLCPRGNQGTAKHLVVSFDGGLIHVDTSSSIEYHILFRGCHEPEIVNLIQRTVRAGDVCLDIGANVGAHALVMARAAGPSGRVIAVEPHPRIYERLLQNVALNRLAHCTTVRAALSDHDGDVDFFGFAEGAFERGVSSLLPDEQAKQKMVVRAIRGAKFQKELRLSRCDFLKIDVEGAESVVLQELSDLIAESRPFIICEYRKQHWRKFGHSLGQVLARLKGLDYQLYYICKNITRPVIGEEIPDSCELFCVPALRESDRPEIAIGKP